MSCLCLRDLNKQAVLSTLGPCFQKPYGISTSQPKRCLVAGWAHVLWRVKRRGVWVCEGVLSGARGALTLDKARLNQLCERAQGGGAGDVQLLGNLRSQRLSPTAGSGR
jgi:hypothetical protein